MKNTSAQAKALILQRIQMLESRTSGRAIKNGAILKLRAHHSSINLEKKHTFCTPKSGSKYVQNIQGLKTRFSEVPNMRVRDSLLSKTRPKKWASI